MKKFIIYTFPYNNNIGGIKVLHKLCHLLNSIGQMAYLHMVNYPHESKSKFVLNSKYNTPIATNEIMSNLDDCIVIYPEIVVGNPLNAKNVVRWILNMASIYEDSYGKDDLIFYYSKLFYSNKLKSEKNILTVIEFHSDLFKNYNLKRTTNSYLVRKCKNPKFIHPSNSIEISWDACGDFSKLINIFNISNYFYCYDEVTFVPFQAAMCGCIPIIVPNKYDKETWKQNSLDISNFGIAFGDTKEEIEYAKKTQPLLMEKILKMENDTTQLKDFIDVCQNKFDEKYLKTDIKVNDISFLISTRNNGNRLKVVYDNIRKFYKQNYIVIVSDASTDNTHTILNELNSNDDKLISFCSAERLNFAKAYNKTIELCPTDLFCFFHDDTFVSENFIENLIKHIHNKKSFVCFSTCEPPIFHQQDEIGKPIKDFGRDYLNLNLDDFYLFSKGYCNENKDKTFSFNGGFFMCGYIETIKQVGLFDTIFYPHFSEDSDLLHRLIINGCNFILSLDSLIYHIPSSTSRFSDEFKDTIRTTDLNGQRNFLRKWHTLWAVIQDFNNMGIKYEKFNCKIILDNTRLDILSNIEPFFDIIKVDDDEIKNKYIKLEKFHTKFNLEEKFNINSKIKVDYICKIDCNKNIDWNTISKLPYIIKNYEEGSYQLNNLIIQIKKYE